MKTSVRLIFLLSIFLPSFFSHAQTVIDYSIIQGTRALDPLQEFSSRLPFAPNSNAVIKHYADLRPEKTERNSRVMVLRLLNGANIEQEFYDYDLNGSFESWKSYKNNALYSQSKIDENSKVEIERTVFNPGGSIDEVLIDRNKTGVFNERNIYKENQIIATLEDKNNDGLFELQTFYIFDEGQSISENAIHKNVPVTPFATSEKIYFAGIYKVESSEPADNLNREIASKLANRITSNPGDLTKVGLSLSEVKDQKRRFTRFDIAEAVKSIYGEQRNRYIILGRMIETPARVGVYIQILGPGIIDTHSAFGFTQSKFEYSYYDAAETLSREIIKRLPALPTEIADSGAGLTDEPGDTEDAPVTEDNKQP